MQDLLADAKEQAERSKAEVRTAALMRIARVETASDREEARQTLRRAVDAAMALAEPDRGYLLEHVEIFAAPVDPTMLKEMPAHRETLPLQMRGDRLIRIMLDHGHADAAFEYLMESDGPEFPFGAGSMVLARSTDAGRRSTILRRMVEKWRASRPRR